jgi:hypothetical protein
MAYFLGFTALSLSTSLPSCFYNNLYKSFMKVSIFRKPNEYESENLDEQ